METLSQFVQRKRDALGLNSKGLAKKCNLELSIIEDIESGKELFLPVTIRQNLAKGLRCSPIEIKMLEKEFSTEFVPMEDIDVLKQRILNGETELHCPKCRTLLNVRIEEMRDLEDNLVYEPKAFCPNCVFQIH